jgi:hypothetical protein
MAEGYPVNHFGVSQHQLTYGAPRQYDPINAYDLEENPLSL